MLVKLEEDWSNWSTYREITRAQFYSQGLDEYLHSADVPTFWSYRSIVPPYTFHKGEWYAAGDGYFASPVPHRMYANSDARAYAQAENKATLLFFESLPKSVFDSIQQHDTLGQKWSALEELYEQREQKVGNETLDSDFEARSSGDINAQSTTSETEIDEHLRKVQEGLFKMLKSATYNSKGSDLRTHLAHMKVLRDGLTQHPIPDGDFIFYILDSFVMSNSEHAAELGRLIVFLNYRAKKQGRPHAALKEVMESLVDYEEAMEELRAQRR